MKLRFSPTSPYVRKVTVTAQETGVAGRIENLPTDPWSPETDLGKDNPLGKVPTLITDAGLVLYDSPVICEYLDSLHKGEKLFPAAGEQRWCALRQQALADGILDAAVVVFLERNRRPAQLRWPDLIENQLVKIRRALKALALEAEDFDDRLTIGQVAAGCALGYLDFRLPEEKWRGSHSALAAWHERFTERPSMQASVPKAPH